MPDRAAHQHCHRCGKDSPVGAVHVCDLSPSGQRCQFCSRPMNVSPLGYQENPFCAECYDERVAKAVEGKRFVGWKLDGDYMTPLWEAIKP